MSATLRLTLTDAADQDLNDQVVVDLFATTSSEHLQAAERVTRELVITGIAAAPGSLYRVLISSANHRLIQFFVSFTGDNETQFSAALPVDPAKVVSLAAPRFADLPPAAQGILNGAQCPSFVQSDGSFLAGPALYELLDDRPLFKACFLNIVAKSALTPLLGGDNCLGGYGELLRIFQDRMFLRTRAALLEAAAHSSTFHSVSPALHSPLPGYHLVSSYKTFDRYGNLQLTFQRQNEVGDDYVVDIDIDDAQGIEHIFQVVRNSVAGPTNPYNIHDILLQQNPKVDPGYRFVFARAAASQAA